MRSAYGASEPPGREPAATVVVDVANVMGSRPDGWWRDRAGAAVRLAADVARLAASGRAIVPGNPEPGHPDPGNSEPPQFVLVLEGAARAAAGRITPAERVRVVTASGSGDDAIVAVLRELTGHRVVVTADRELRQRSEAVGAQTQGPGWLLRLLSAAEPEGELSREE